MPEYHTVSKIALIIASTGRAQILQKTVESILRRTYVPDQIILVGAIEEDIPAIHTDRCGILALISPVRGITHQRNFALRSLSTGIKYISFLDDDTEVHDQYFLEVERCFTRNLNLVAFSGLVLENGNISREEGRETLNNHIIPQGMPDYGFLKDKWAGLYGCTMNFRYEFLILEKFDENLIKYSLGEDIEIGFRMSKFGDVGGSARCPIVHLASSGGRGTEVKLGYSQIANCHYFVTKGIGYPFRKFFFENLMGIPLKNFLGIFGSKSNGPHQVDRIGRFKGNMLAILDLMLGRIHPSRINRL